MKRRARLLLTAAFLAAPFLLATVRGDDAKPSEAEVLRRVEQAVPGFQFKSIKREQWFEGFRHHFKGTDATSHPVTVVTTAWGKVIRVETWFHRDDYPDLDWLIHFAAGEPELWNRVTRIVRITKDDGLCLRWCLMGIEMRRGREAELAIFSVPGRDELDDRDKPE